MADPDDLSARARQFARDLLEALDAPEDPERQAACEQKERRDQEALERLYVGTGQKRWIPEPIEQGPLIAAWDHASPGLAIYAVATSGAQRLQYAPVPTNRRDATTAEQRQRGLRVGGCYSGCDIVWVADEHGASAWSTAGVRFEGTRSELKLQGGALKVDDMTAIVSFVDHDYVRRGVRAALRDGSEVTLVEDHDELARLDPTFGHNELLMSDAGWTRHLGRDVAASLRLPFHDRVFGSSTDPAIVMALQDLADRVQVLMPVGAFPPVQVPLVTAGGTQARLRFLPLASQPDGDRVVEVEVLTPNGPSTSPRWLTRARNEEILAALRRADTADEVAAIIPELAESLQRHRPQ